jgi:hypothetical protein
MKNQDSSKASFRYTRRCHCYKAEDRINQEAEDRINQEVEARINQEVEARINQEVEAGINQDPACPCCSRWQKRAALKKDEPIS